MTENGGPSPVQVKVRMKPPLREALARSATERGVSLNAEVISRLEEAFLSERDIYGGPHTATLMKLLGLTVRMVEQATGKNWDTDLETHRAMRRAIAGVLSVFDLPPETDFQQENEQLVGLRAAVKALRMAGLSKDQIEQHFSPESVLVMRGDTR
ncbi:MAG: Arc family DNA-binding protein [Rhodospirillales bacterium]|nr:Arc family DNA-binding protein [Rhodospirillales bacterium]